MSRNKQTIEQLIEKQAKQDYEKRIETLEAINILSAYFKIKADSFPESDKDNLKQQIYKDYKGKVQILKLFFPNNRLRLFIKFKNARKLKNIILSKPKHTSVMYTLIKKYRASVEILQSRNFDKEIEDQEKYFDKEIEDQEKYIVKKGKEEDESSSNLVHKRVQVKGPKATWTEVKETTTRTMTIDIERPLSFT
jgi:hypothetical protein